MMTHRNNYILLPVLLLLIITFCESKLFPTPYKQFVDPSNIVDDANCTIRDVDISNADVYASLQRIVKQPFFKVFKVDLDSECPFWAMKKMCSGKGGCNVCQCDDSDIPIAWKQTKMDKVNTFLGTGTYRPIKKWEDDDANCWIQSTPEAKMTYVNLLLNPETRTGYSGEDAARVWRAIYNENCFTGNLKDMCMEERVFYRLISGLHMSITMKIATYYHKDEDIKSENITYDMFQPNYEMFDKVIAPFPDRIKNLYFLYSFTQRALQKSATALSDYNYDTGNAQEDLQTKRLMKELLQFHESCGPTFDETLMFRTEERYSLRNQMRSHFRNITNIMDCVSCEKCKMWAKLEMLGLATALKIVLADESDKTVMQNLQRNEIIALINSFKQHAQSIADFQKFEQAKFNKEMAPYLSIGFSSVMALVVASLLLRVFISKKEKPTQPRTETSTDNKKDK